MFIYHGCYLVIMSNCALVQWLQFISSMSTFPNRWQEANFIGKESIRKLKPKGLHRTLVFLTVNTKNIDPQGNETVWHDNKVRYEINALDSIV